MSSELLNGEITEAELMGTLMGVARQFGWGCYHTHDSRRSEAGFPDLVLVRDDALIFWELKRERGKVTPAQQRWLDALALTGAEARVIRPSDLDAAIDRLRPRKPGDGHTKATA